MNEKLRDTSIDAETSPSGAIDAYKNLKKASDLYDMVYRIKRHQLRQKYPSASSEWLHRSTVSLIEKQCL